jgi:hypothetical protein
MSNKILNRIWEDKTVKSSRDRLALLALGDQANDDGLCWPGLKSIEKRMNCSRPTVVKAITHLENLGAITTFESHGESGRRSNHYIVKVGMSDSDYDKALQQVKDKIGHSEAREPAEVSKPVLPPPVGKPILSKHGFTNPVNTGLHDPLVNPKDNNPNNTLPANAGNAENPPEDETGEKQPKKRKEADPDSPYGIYEQLKQIDAGVLKGQSLREIKVLLEGDGIAPPRSPADIVACGRFLQTDPWRIEKMLTLSTRDIMKKIDKWIDCGRPATWEDYQRHLKGNGHTNGRSSSITAPAEMEWESGPRFVTADNYQEGWEPA